MSDKPDSGPHEPQMVSCTNDNSSSVNIVDLISEYINEMSEQEQKVMKIAQNHLESSFSIEKSIGFKNWLARKTIM